MADDAGHDEPVVVYSLRVELQPSGGYVVVERAYGSGVCAAGEPTVAAALERLVRWAEVSRDSVPIREEILNAAERAEHEARLRKAGP